jgi:hypothetical protein
MAFYIQSALTDSNGNRYVAGLDATNRLVLQSNTKSPSQQWQAVGGRLQNVGSNPPLQITCMGQTSAFVGTAVGDVYLMVPCPDSPIPSGVLLVLALVPGRGDENLAWVVQQTTNLITWDSYTINDFLGQPAPNNIVWFIADV